MGCPENAREEWVPPEFRSIDRMKRNTGETSADSFVYFPKKLVQFTKDYAFMCIEIPVGAQLYRGYRGWPPCTGEDAVPISPSWFSDYKTATIYGTKEGVMAYETTMTTYLINFVDKHNIDIFNELLGKRQISYATAPELHKNIPDYSLAFHEAMMDTPYIDPYQGYSDTNPEERDKVLKEFGYTSPPILRRSFELLDKEFTQELIHRIIGLVDRKMENMITPILGFYSPVLPAVVNTKCRLKVFHREILLFSPRRCIKHNPANELDSCERLSKKYTVGSSRSSLLRNKSRLSTHRRKTSNRSSLRPKHRLRTNRNR